MLELTPEAKQSFEIKANEVIIEGECPNELSASEKASLNGVFAHDSAPGAPATNTFQAVFRVRSVVAQAIHRFFDERGFVYVHTPIFTGSDCEGAGEMFRVTTLDMDNPPRTEDGKVDFSKDFFGKPCNLTVSGQLHGEAFALAFRVFTRSDPHSVQKTATPTSCRGVLADRSPKWLSATSTATWIPQRR